MNEHRTGNAIALGRPLPGVFPTPPWRGSGSSPASMRGGRNAE